MNIHIVMGAAKSKSYTMLFNETINNTLNESLVKYVENNSLSSKIDQNLIINDLHCDGDLDISKVKMTAKTTVNFDGLSKKMTQQQLDKMLDLAVKQGVTKIQKTDADFLPGIAVSSEKTKVINRIINNTKNSFNLQNFRNSVSTAETNQLFEIKNSYAKNCTIKDITMEATVDVISKSIAEDLTTSFVSEVAKVDNVQAAKLEQSATSSSNWMQIIIIIFICLIVLVIIAGGVAFFVFKKKGKPFKIPEFNKS